MESDPVTSEWYLLFWQPYELKYSGLAYEALRAHILDDGVENDLYRQETTFRVIQNPPGEPLAQS